MQTTHSTPPPPNGCCCVSSPLRMTETDATAISEAGVICEEKPGQRWSAI